MKLSQSNWTVSVNEMNRETTCISIVKRLKHWQGLGGKVVQQKRTHIYCCTKNVKKFNKIWNVSWIAMQYSISNNSISIVGHMCMCLYSYNVFLSADVIVFISTIFFVFFVVNMHQFYSTLAYSFSSTLQRDVINLEPTRDDVVSCVSKGKSQVSQIRTRTIYLCIYVIYACVCMSNTKFRSKLLFYLHWIRLLPRFNSKFHKASQSTAQNKLF